MPQNQFYNPAGLLQAAWYHQTPNPGVPFVAPGVFADGTVFAPQYKIGQGGRGGSHSYGKPRRGRGGSGGMNDRSAMSGDQRPPSHGGSGGMYQGGYQQSQPQQQMQQGSGVPQQMQQPQQQHYSGYSNSGYGNGRGGARSSWDGGVKKPSTAFSGASQQPQQGYAYNVPATAPSANVVVNSTIANSNTIAPSSSPSPVSHSQPTSTSQALASSSGSSHATTMVSPTTSSIAPTSAAAASLPVDQSQQHMSDLHQSAHSGGRPYRGSEDYYGSSANYNSYHQRSSMESLSGRDGGPR
jgi:hypothetical protein